MDPVKYKNIARYLSTKTYEKHLSKPEGYSVRRSSKSYRVATKDDGQQMLYYEKNGVSLIVIKGEEEKRKIFSECHMSEYGGHVGRDNTFRKISARYYWPDYYKHTVALVSFSFLYLLSISKF